jgi:peptidoglycan/xylan/chitin deacetylase (PgdA/CDA1 family)
MAYFIHHPEVIPQMSAEARKSLANYKAEIGAEKLVRFLSNVTNSDRMASRISRMTPSPADSPPNWQQLVEPPIWHRRWKSNLRSMGKRFVINGKRALNQRPKANGHRILIYHLVLKEDRKLFEEHIKFLKDNFVVTSVSEVLRTATEAKNKNGYCAAITFDDGFRILMRDCLDVLNKYDIKATFFVPTGFVDLSDRPDRAAIYSLRAHYYNLPLEPMRPQDLRLLVDLGHEVGSHGVAHVGLNALSFRAAEQELKRSKARIAQWTEKDPTGFAYPYGHFKSSLGEPPEWVRSAGYRYAVTQKRGAADQSSNLFLLPRDHVEGNWTLRDLSFFLLK